MTAIIISRNSNAIFDKNESKEKGIKLSKTKSIINQQNKQRPGLFQALLPIKLWPRYPPFQQEKKVKVTQNIVLLLNTCRETIEFEFEFIFFCFCIHISIYNNKMRGTISLPFHYE